jgi:predicted enzyme related to lactoylglutathione lyase
VRDIQKTIARVKRYGGRVKRGPRKIDFRPAELQVVYAATIADPDGNEFDLHQVLKRFRK